MSYLRRVSGPMEAIVLDGATLTPAAVALIARRSAPVELAPAARARNESARRAVDAVLARGDELYGASTGVGPLRTHRVDEGDRSEHQIGLLRSHACGAGRELPDELVRAAMATRANQLGAGGAGVCAELLGALVDALNDIALALLGEGRVRHDGRELPAAAALGAAGIAPGRLGPRDGLAFMSSNAVSIAHAALLVADESALLEAWLTVAGM